MSNRLDTKFAELKKQGKTAFIAFITAGDPHQDATAPAMHALVSGGTDIIELGVPFSDPSADGPTIQKSNERALTTNTSIIDVFRIVTEFRQTDAKTPVVLMGYLNPIENMGYKEFAKSAAVAGVDGLITIDLPPEESADFNDILDLHDLYPIYLLAPTSTGERIKKICSVAKGFIYYVSIKGVTGAKEPDHRDVQKHITTIREVTDLPIGVGFGVKDSKGVQAISEYADAVVVGSALINRMAEDEFKSTAEILANFTRELTQGI